MMDMPRYFLEALVERLRPVAAVAIAGVLFGQTAFLLLERSTHISGFARPFWLLALAWLLLFLATRALSRGASLSAAWRRSTALDKLFLLFVVLLCGSYTARGQASALLLGKHVLLFVILPYMVLRSFTLEQLRVFLLAGMGVATLVTAVSWFTLLVVQREELLSADRIELLRSAAVYATGTEGDPTGQFLGVAVCGSLVGLFYLVVWLSDNRSLSVLRTVVLALFAFATVWLLMRAGGRAYIVGSFLALATMIVVRWYPRTSTIIIGLVALVGLFAAAFATMPTERVMFIDQLFVDGREAALNVDGREATLNVDGREAALNVDGREAGREAALNTSIQTRLALLAEGWELFTAHPIAGVGAGNFSYRSAAAGGEPLASPHQIFLHAAVELGVPGATVLAAMHLLAIVWLIRAHVRGSAGERRLFLALGGVLIVFMTFETLSGNYFSAFHLFAAFGAVSAVGARMIRRE